MTADTIRARDADARHAAHSEPTGALSEDELLQKTEKGDIHTVVLAVPGATGMSRGKEYDAGYFLSHVLDHGTHAAGYLLTTDADMRVLPGFSLGGWEHGAGDVLLRPDPRSLRPAGWLERTAFVLADAYDQKGERLAIAPRTVLDRQLSRLAGLGLTASLGIEAEATVYDISYSDAARRGYRELPPAADYNTDYALDRPARLDGLISRIRRCAYDSRLPLEAVKTEAGAGQLEVTFRHSDPMSAADAHLVYKLLAHAAAESLGMALTFMAKTFSNKDGNSCHLHLSLTNASGKSTLVDDRGRLTETGQHAVAGCLALLDQFAILMLPNVNSYNRVHADPRLFAPNTLTWGYDNRTCGLRILGAGETGRIECRIPGADAQPHLAAAALLAAVADGIEDRLPLEDEPVTGNAYADAHATRLPRSLDDARIEFSHSQRAADLFGAEIVSHYTQVAWHEAEYHRARVTDLERERGFIRA